MLFEQLVDPAYTIIADAEPSALVDAAVNTLDFLDDDDPATHAQPTTRDASVARDAFTSLTGGAPTDITQQHVTNLKTPAAVRHLVGMLSAYDWDFVEQAKELRGYVVSKLLEETRNPDARIRLRALQLVGTVTEVAAFTERSEVVHKQEGAHEVEERLRAKLKSLLPPVQVVQDVEINSQPATDA